MDIAIHIQQHLMTSPKLSIVVSDVSDEHVAKVMPIVQEAANSLFETWNTEKRVTADLVRNPLPALEGVRKGEDE